MRERRDIRILLVEDEMLIRELAAEDLTEAGFAVTAAGSGDEAIALLESDGDFQLLFTDIHMPGEICGRTLAQQAREKIPGLPVIYATGISDPLDGLDSCDRCVRKPYLFDDVLQAMAELGLVPR